MAARRKTSPPTTGFSGLSATVSLFLARSLVIPGPERLFERIPPVDRLVCLIPSFEPSEERPADSPPLPLLPGLMDPGLGIAGERGRHSARREAGKQRYRRIRFACPPEHHADYFTCKVV